MTNGEIDSKVKSAQGKSIIYAVVTALIISAIATTVNDYLQFKESDAIHGLNIDKLRDDIKQAREDSKAEMEQIRVSLRREMEQLRIQFDAQNRFYRDLIVQGQRTMQDRQQKLGELDGRIKNIESTIYKGIKDER